MFFQNKNAQAILPLEGEGEQVYSYRGLTYSGWIFRKGLEQAELHAILEKGLSYLKEKGKKVLFLNPVPEFFCSESQSNYFQFLTLLGGKILKTRDFYFTRLPFHIQDRGKRWGRKKAQKNRILIRQSSNLDEFWNQVLIPCLHERHQSQPIHSLEEIQLLKSRFPSQIALWVATVDEQMIAGTILFLIGNVVHCQYIASTEMGRKLRALDLLFPQLMEEVFAEKSGFSLGTAVLPETGLPDIGLIHWKESFGAKPIAVPYFRFDLNSGI